MSKLVEHEIGIASIKAINIPYVVQIRLMLNSVGFEFEDDGKLSCIVNKCPKPLGTLTIEKSIDGLALRFKQTIG